LNVKIKYIKTVIRAFENGSCGEYLGLRRMSMGSGEGSTMRNFIVYTVHLIFVFCICFDGVLPNALRPFKIHCAPLNLDIRTKICRLNFAQRPIFSDLRFFNEPEISDLGTPA
jgi:hypothetical protein